MPPNTPHNDPELEEAKRAAVDALLRERANASLQAQIDASPGTGWRVLTWDDEYGTVLHYDGSKLNPPDNSTQIIQMTNRQAASFRKLMVALDPFVDLTIDEEHLPPLPIGPDPVAVEAYQREIEEANAAASELN